MVTVMRAALDNMGGRILDFVNKPVFLVDFTAPISVHVFQRFGIANTRVSVARNVLEQVVDAFYGFFVLTEPITILLPRIVAKIVSHVGPAGYTSTNSRTAHFPASIWAMDSFNLFWFSSL